MSAGFFALLSAGLLQEGDWKRVRAFLAGAAAGYATMIDYPLAAFAVLTALALTLAAFFRPRHAREITRGSPFCSVERRWLFCSAITIIW
ncbi:MAG: hypothetical protein U1D30_25220 [Planctomycetota bacterium]